MNMSNNRNECLQKSKLVSNIPEQNKNRQVLHNRMKNDALMSRQESYYDVDEMKEENDSQGSKILLDEDFKQKISMGITVTIEMYRVIMSSLLLLFVPQSCNNNQCSINEKMSPETQFEIFVLVSNFFTLCAFTVTYIIESRRENILITYLDVNRFKPRDNFSVAKELLLLSKKRLNRIEKYDKMYKYLSYSSIFVFILNTLFSTIIIFDHFLDSKTITVLLTNMLFMSSKLYDMYDIVNTKDFVFLSAYLTSKIQFNDVDKDKIESKESLFNSDVKPELYSNYYDSSAPPLQEV